MCKKSFFVWKNRVFFYNSPMSQFKTKRLTMKVAKVTPESEEVVEKIPKKKWLSYKIIIGVALGILSLFFVIQVATKAFQWNSKNGSENFIPSIIEEFVAEKVKWTTNILIAGIGGKGHDGNNLTDSIMLASLDGATHHVTLISIPRDLYVAYPLEKWAGKINSLYDVGKSNKVGITYLAEKVREITGQPIDHYIVVDFSGFKQIIDILGWVSIDVPEDLTDREYPDNNWGYLVFSVKKWLQVFDGETALRYARSRHSTSDFDRSNRQQLIIKAIKEKASDLWYITNPEKIGELYNAVISHLDTDMSIAKMAEFALTFKDVKSENISIVSLSDVCLSLTKCVPGSYLYAPSRELFGWSAVIIPENAQANKLSYYDDIRRFVELTFRFPSLRLEERNIVIVSDISMKKRAQEIGFGLAKAGFPLSFDKTLTTSGSIEKSHINIYYHSDLNIGISPLSIAVLALKHLEEAIPYTLVERNEYINTSGPRIEIVIGKDANEYFTLLKNPYYLPIVPKVPVSGEAGNTSGSSLPKTFSWQKNENINILKATYQAISWENKIVPWEWENF